MGMCAMTREKRLASPAWVPKSYQRSARIPSGPGSLRRGMRFRVREMNSAIWEVKICVMWLVSGRAGSGPAVDGQRVETLNFLHDVSGDCDWRIVPRCC